MYAMFYKFFQRKPKPNLGVLGVGVGRQGLSEGLEHSYDASGL